ncbi:GNAT family N-acetyltransferase [Variovorax sp. M-6]|uniref:GNAT family N-acetyltransferase n=1 Tax=Variovorax sp. M-6 TaxID=3233041 RepID=UPI003F9DEC51
MHDDIFDEVSIRSAFERSLQMRARPLIVTGHGSQSDTGWFFERSRFGMRRVEVAPIGFYASLCADDARLAALRRFIDSERLSLRNNVRINLNPLETHSGDLISYAASRGYGVVMNQAHLLPIGPSIDAMRAKYHSTKRYEALREVRIRSLIRVADNVRDLDDYFSVYAASLMRWGRNGFVYPPDLFRNLLSSPAVRFWMHYVEDRLACAMVVLYSRSYALYWQGVSRIDGDQKPAYPMVKLMDAVLQDLVQRGVPVLNLGASGGLPNVQRFKEGFGALPKTYASLTFRSPIWRIADRVRRAVPLAGSKSDGKS